jgi:hypothetical protein
MYGAGMVTAWSLVAGLAVEAASDCPSAAMVRARLEPLLPAQMLEDSADTAWLIGENEGQVRLRLTRADGTLVGERLLERALGCQELARAAAVALAAWLSDIHPEFAPAGLLEPDAPAPAAAPGPAPPRGGGWDVAIGGAAALPDGSLTPALQVDAGWSHRPAGLGLRGMAVLSGTRNEPLGSAGRAVWARHVVIAAVSLRRAWRSVAVEALVGPAGGLFTVRGEGFGQNHSSHKLLAGGAAGLRASRAMGRWAPWLGAVALAWPRRQHLRTGTGSEERTLHPFDIYVGAGLRLVLGRL